MDTELMSVINPPVPPQYGSMKVQQIKELVGSDIKAGACIEERKEVLSDFFVPKIGDYFTAALDYM